MEGVKLAKASGKQAVSQNFTVNGVSEISNCKSKAMLLRIFVFKHNLIGGWTFCSVNLPKVCRQASVVPIFHRERRCGKSKRQTQSDVVANLCSNIIYSAVATFYTGNLSKVCLRHSNGVAKFHRERRCRNSKRQTQSKFVTQKASENARCFPQKTRWQQRRKKTRKNAKKAQNNLQKTRQIVWQGIDCCAKIGKLRKRGLTRKVTEKTENLLPTHTKPRVLWPNCCFES